MPEAKRKCFVMMPFVPELHYFYLYLKQHIEQHHGISCERADDRILTKPFLDKINDLIRDADVIIADCSSRNPNVFYELGIAHALNKNVILITKDPVGGAPSDIRHFEFIHYELQNHVEFLKRLDNALRNIFAMEYENLYENAKNVFTEFRQAMNAQVDMASKEIFIDRVIAVESKLGLPPMDDALAVAEFVLTRIIADTTDLKITTQILTWNSQKWKTP